MSAGHYELKETTRTLDVIRHDLKIPATSPYLAGHFPGDPILPGVAQVQIFVEALSTSLDQRLAWREVEVVRFRRPVRPGARYELVARLPDQDGVAGFELMAAEGLVADGRLRLVAESGSGAHAHAHAEPVEVARTESARAERAIADTAARCLPHSGAALLVTEVLESDDESTLCRARFPIDSPFVRNLEVPTWIGAEPAAQAAATHLALVATARGVDVDQQEGFLTGMKHLHLWRQSLPVDTDLHVRIRPRGGTRIGRGLYKFRFELHCEDELAARGELSTFVQSTTA